MAQKNSSSRADRAVKDANKKASKVSAENKTAANKKKQTAPPEPPVTIPSEVMIPLICIGLFVLFLVIAVNPDGALLKVIESILVGLIGKAGFYIAIPALLYLFVIHIFSAKTAVKMRSICLTSFVILCGCIYHLAVRPDSFSGGFAFVSELYKGGMEGYSGGFICGALGELLHWSCGDVISYIILCFAAILTLLGSMQITVPSLVRAIKNRPRDDWEDEEEEEYVEPATLVVNHIANKRIEHNRQRRQRMEQEQEGASGTYEQMAIAEPAKQSKRTAAEKANDMMNQIDEIGSPVAAAADHVAEDTVQKPEAAQSELPSELIPQTMPLYEPAAPIPEAPKMEAKAEPAPKVEVKTDKVTAKDAAVSAQQVAEEIAQTTSAPKVEYCFPPINLLNRPSRGMLDGTAEMRENKRRLN